MNRKYHGALRGKPHIGETLARETEVNLGDTGREDRVGSEGTSTARNHSFIHSHIPPMGTEHRTHQTQLWVLGAKIRNPWHFIAVRQTHCPHAETVNDPVLLEGDRC